MIFWHDLTRRLRGRAGIWDIAGPGRPTWTAMMYDGFAPLVLYGLEEFGLVPKGEAGAFLGAGEHLATGSLPLNPHGGNNSEGRSHAIGHVVEAALQLRGDASERQLPDVHATIVNGGAITLSARWCCTTDELHDAVVVAGVSLPSAHPRTRLSWV